MTVQQLEPGCTYKAEVEFTVDPSWDPDSGSQLVKDTTNKYRVIGFYDKITKVCDRFEQGALYEDGFTGRVLRRTGYDEPFGPKWAAVPGGYVHSNEVDEGQLTRLYREGEK